VVAGAPRYTFAGCSHDVRITRNILEPRANDVLVQGMGTNWTPLRFKQHQANYPPEEKAERNRLAQARYRARRAEHNAKVRTVVNIVSRQRSDHGELEQLATALRGLLTPAACRQLAAELRRKPRRD
jgi:hypothetical protein